MSRAFLLFSLPPTVLWPVGIVCYYFFVVLFPQQRQTTQHTGKAILPHLVIKELRGQLVHCYHEHAVILFARSRSFVLCAAEFINVSYVSCAPPLFQIHHLFLHVNRHVRNAAQSPIKPGIKHDQGSNIETSELGELETASCRALVLKDRRYCQLNMETDGRDVAAQRQIPHAIPSFVGPLVRSRHTKPCPIYFEVSFLDKPQVIYAKSSVCDGRRIAMRKGCPVVYL